MDRKRKLKECKADAHNLFSRFCLFACLFACPDLFCFLFLAQDIFEAIVSTRDVHTSEANASTEYTSPFEQPTSQHTRRQPVPPSRVSCAPRLLPASFAQKNEKKITPVLQAIVTLSLHLFCPGLYELKANTSTKARLHFKRWKCVTYVLAK